MRADSGDSVVIVGALRTPIGALGGGLSSLSAAFLGAHVLKALLKTTNLPPEDVSEVILGQVLTAGTGQNPARQAAMRAGLPQETTAWTLNQVCGSGLRAVALGAQQIKLKEASVVLCGGQESMSQAPHATFLRTGVKMGDHTLVDTMIKDGLWEAFHDCHMAITAENVARIFSITRAEQDAFALSSLHRAERAQASGRFDEEITPVPVLLKKEEILFALDERIRKGATLEALTQLRPSFDKAGTVTAGNASGVNDGAACVALMSLKEAEKRGLPPLARIVSSAVSGVDPKIMGTGPIPASRQALAKAGWNVEDLDLIEANEAFAAQACAVNKEMGWDSERVNVNGGAIALGHPIGASGARVLVTLVHEMRKRGARKGLATLCIGGGMGVALCVARDD